MKGRRPPRQREDDHQVEQDEGRQAHHDARDHLTEIPSKNGEEGHTNGLRALLRLGKNRRLRDAEAHIEAEQDEDRARKKRKPPPECEELLIGQNAREQQIGMSRRKEEIPPALQAGETFHRARASTAEHSRRKAARRHPTLRQVRCLAQSGTAPAAAARRFRWLLYDGKTPIRNVDRPMVVSAMTSVLFRPARSPKWPKSAPPMGRARNAIPKSGKRCTVHRCCRISRREEQLRENQHRCRCIAIKRSSELDSRTHETLRREL